MTQNKSFKNLGISLLLAAFLIYTLILTPSTVGLIVAIVTIGALLLISYAYNKNLLIVQKIDLYILITYIGYHVIIYGQIIGFFTANTFVESMEDYEVYQIMSLIGLIILGLIFNAIGENRATTLARVIFKTIGALLPSLGLSIFCWGSMNIGNIASLVLIGVAFSLIAFARGVRTESVVSVRRPMRIAFWLGVLSVLISVFFPYNYISPLYYVRYISYSILPWYSVLILSFILLSTITIDITKSNNKLDEDGIFLIGLLGLIWVVKAVVSFYFYLSWIAVCIYLILMTGFFNRFAKRKKKNSSKISLYSKLSNNEFWWIAIAAVSLVILVFLISKGYIYLAISLLVGAVAVPFVHRLVTSWFSEAMFWITMLFVIAFSACMICIQSGYCDEKILIISALFVFSAVIMVLLCHENSIGKNKFVVGKIVMVLVFAILVVIPAFKGGSHVEMELDGGNGNVSSPAVTLEIEADGKNNEVVNMEYVWTDSFVYDPENIVSGDTSYEYILVEANHLIVWTTDSNGITARTDYWFTPDYVS